MYRYERVTYYNTSKPYSPSLPVPKRTIILRVNHANALFVTGLEVDKYGDAVRHGKVDETRHIIEKSLIVRTVPMVMDKTYAQLFVTKGEN